MDRATSLFFVLAPPPSRMFTRQKMETFSRSERPLLISYTTKRNQRRCRPCHICRSTFDIHHKTSNSVYIESTLLSVIYDYHYNNQTIKWRRDKLTNEKKCRKNNDDVTVIANRFLGNDEKRIKIPYNVKLRTSLQPVNVISFVVRLHQMGFVEGGTLLIKSSVLKFVANSNK